MMMMTMKYCCKDFRLHNLRCERCGARLVPFVLDRSPPICQESEQASRLRSSCVTVYRKDRFSARSYFYCTRTADIAAFVGSHGLHMSTSMLTTLKYMDLVHRCQLINYSQAYRPALTMFLAGWRQIGSS